MSHVDRGGTDLLVKPPDFRPCLHAQLGVEVGQRLVHEEHLRLTNECAPESDALPLPARQRARFPLQQRRDVEHVSSAADPPLDLIPGHLARLQAEGEVVPHAHLRIQRVVLEDHRDIPVPRREPVHHPFSDGDVTLGQRLEPGNQAQGGGLAGPRRADEHHELAIGDLQREISKSGDVAETFA